MTSDDTSVGSVSRRQLLTASGAAIGLASGAVGAVGAQTATGTDQGGEAQIYTRAIVPRVGRPFEGEYVGQYVIFTDPTPNEEISPAIVGECEFAEWAPSETRGYQGLLIDRLTDEPRGIEIPMYLNANQERVDVGNAFIIDRVTSCSDDFLGLQLEDVPISRFEPEYDTVENPLVGEEPGPGVTPEGETETPGQPGYGVVSAVLGIVGATLLRRMQNS